MAHDARGVHVFEIIERLHIDELWLRDQILRIKPYRWSRIKAGLHLFRFEEAERLVEVFSQAPYNVPRHEIVEFGADVLPARRQRRAKGTVKRPSEGSAA